MNDNKPEIPLRSYHQSPHWRHRTSRQSEAGAFRQGSYLPTVPTLAILASPVDPVVSYEGWLEDRKVMGMGEGLDR